MHWRNGSKNNTGIKSRKLREGSRISANLRKKKVERDYLSLNSEYVLALKLPSGQHREYEEVSLAWWEIPGAELRMSSQ